MKKSRLCNLIYAVFCLVYAVWMIHLSSYEFARIHGQYRSAVNNLEPDRIKALALEELTDECRRQQGRSSDWQGAPCSEWSPAQVEVKGKKIEERLVQVKKRYGIKLVLFYISFVVFFLLAPLILLYLLLVVIIKLKVTINIVK